MSWLLLANIYFTIDPGLYETQCHGRGVYWVAFDSAGAMFRGNLEQVSKSKVTSDFMDKVYYRYLGRTVQEQCDELKQGVS